MTIYGTWPALISAGAFFGLGVAGGVLWDRLRRSEALASKQLELARDLQQRLLPPPALNARGCRITARNVPAAHVAGDFYDFVPLGKERLLLVIADVAGKGAGAGLIMATVKGMIPLLATEATIAASLLGRLNEEMSGRLEARDFVAMIVAIYLPAERTLSIANAGLPDPLFVGANGSARTIAVSGPRYPIGTRKNMSYESLTVRLGEGDRVFFFTDGLPEAPVRGEPLGYERLSAEVVRARGDIDALFSSLEQGGAAHEDDWTALLLESV